jgi:hypothetical protein
MLTSVGFVDVGAEPRPELALGHGLAYFITARRGSRCRPVPLLVKTQVRREGTRPLDILASTVIGTRTGIDRKVGADHRGGTEWG